MPTDEERAAGRLAFEPIRPVLESIGFAILLSQRVERWFGLAVGLLTHSRPTTAEEIDAVVGSFDRRTAGQIAAALREHTPSSVHLHDELSEFVAARNRLVHRLFHEPEHNLDESESRAAAHTQVRIVIGLAYRLSLIALDILHQCARARGFRGIEDIDAFRDSAREHHYRMFEFPLGFHGLGLTSPDGTPAHEPDSIQHPE